MQIAQIVCFVSVERVCVFGFVCVVYVLLCVGECWCGECGCVYN